MIPFKWPRPLFTRPELWYHLLSIPAVYPVSCGVLMGERYFNRLDVFLVGTLTILANHIVYLVILTVIVKGIMAHYANVQQAQRRNLTTLGVGALLSALMSVNAIWVCSWVPLLQASFSTEGALYMAGIGAVAALTMGYLLIVSDTYARWQENQTEKEQLRQMVIQQQFDALKGQINPHRSGDPVCVQFAQFRLFADCRRAAAGRSLRGELTKVYRYMLQAHTRTWVPLEAEIQFARSYAQLLMVRYGRALAIQIDLPTTDEQQGIPPLTYDILYHQTVQTSKPLRIDIRAVADRQLLIQYKRQPRALRVGAQSAGFNDVVNLYELMGASPPHRETVDGEDRIRLPLISVSLGSNPKSTRWHG